MVKFLYLSFMGLISFSIFTHLCSLKIGNENNSTNTPINRSRVPTVQFNDKETYPGWLELPLTGTNFHGPKPVQATEVLILYLWISVTVLMDIN